MEIVPNLHFNGACENAIDLYERAFKGRRLEFLRYTDADPRDIDEKSSNAKGARIYHCEMVIGQQRLFLSDHDHEDDLPYGMNVSLLISFDSAEEVQEAYEILKDGARIITPLRKTTYSSCFVSLVDRYGVRWELIKEN
jgi:PhnB protein